MRVAPLSAVILGFACRQPVAPAAAVRDSGASYFPGSLLFAAFNSGYGYFWWTFPLHRGGTDAGVIAASGSGGQWLFVIPSLDLVVAIAAQSGAGLDLLYDGLLPALR